MTTSALLIVVGIASCFLLFGVVLAWADFYSRDANRQPAPGQAHTASTENEYREAA